MNTFKLLQSKRKGSTIALVMIVLVVLLLAGAGLLNLGLQSRMAAIRDATEISARCAADAGLAKALYEMNQLLDAGKWSDSNLPYAMYEPLPGTDATFSYTVTPDANYHYNLQAMGNAGRTQKAVSASLGIKGLFEYALFANTISLKSGTTVSAYNLAPGDNPLKIGTNSTVDKSITAKTGVTIDGNVLVGPGGNVDTVIDNRLESTITGTASSLMEPHDLPSISVPDWLLALPSQGAITGNTTINSSAKYDSISLLGTGSLITIDGDVTLYVVGDLRLGNSDQMLIVDESTNPNASLTLYIGGNILADNGSTFNNLTTDTHKLKIYALDTCTSIQFKNGGNLYGAIYAPTANIQLYNGVQVYGSIVGKSFYQDVNANFHYDASLRMVSAEEEGVRFVVERWSEQQ